jgi:hypothetical protein
MRLANGRSSHLAHSRIKIGTVVSKYFPLVTHPNTVQSLSQCSGATTGTGIGYRAIIAIIKGSINRRVENEEVVVSVTDTRMGLPYSTRRRPSMHSLPPSLTAPATPPPDFWLVVFPRKEGGSYG